MDWGVSIFYLSVAALAMRAARGHERLYGGALIANVAIFNLAGVLVTPDIDPSMNMLTELMLFEASIICMVCSHSRIFLWLAMLSVISMTISALQSFHFWHESDYQGIVNAIFLAECLTLCRRRIWRVGRLVHDRYGRGGLRGYLDAGRLRRHGLAPVSLSRSGNSS